MTINIAFMADHRPSNRNKRSPGSEILAESLSKIVSMISPIEQQHDEAFAKLVLSSDDYVEPVGKNEMLVLGTGLHTAATDLANKTSGSSCFGYADVQTLTERFGGKPLGTGSIHAAIERLLHNGLLEREKDIKPDRQGRPMLKFSITPEGRVAFFLSMTMADVIREARDNKAA